MVRADSREEGQVEKDITVIGASVAASLSALIVACGSGGMSVLGAGVEQVDDGDGVAGCGGGVGVQLVTRCESISSASCCCRCSIILSIKILLCLAGAGGGGG